MSSDSGSDANGQGCTAELAMKAALEHIACHGFIDERRTKLNCRLVCKEWRSHVAFSDTITAVALRSVASAYRLAEYYPPVPSIRSPWQTLEESRVFLNLKQIHICSRLTNLDLRSLAPTLSTEADAFVTACGQFDLSVEVTSIRRLKEWIPLLQSMGTLSALLVKPSNPYNHYSPAQESFVLDLEAMSSITRLSKLTSLTLLPLAVHGDIAEKLAIFGLAGLVSLQHLDVVLQFEKLNDVYNKLKAFGTLTMVTYLDLTIEAAELNMYQEESYGLPCLLRDLRKAAPKFLRQCKIQNLNSRIPIGRKDYNTLDQATYKSGRLYDCHFCMHFSSMDLEKNDATVNGFLKTELQGRDLQGLAILVPWETVKPHSGFLFGTEALQGVKELRLEINFWKVVRSGQTTALGALFAKQKGIQMTATSLSCKVGTANMAVDYTNLVNHLPSVLPNLQRLLLYDVGCPSSLTGLSHLSALTYLCLDASFRNVTPIEFDLSGLPPLLKELKVIGSSLLPTPAPLLLHLTRLELRLLDGGNPVSVFSQSAAPLKELVVDWQSTFYPIVSAFPRVEKLRMFHSEGEPSCLVELKLLRELSIQLPCSKVPQLDILTQVYRLDFSEY